ncbi:MAG: tetratricopeptide repeat protein [Vicinamibacterales bacterium]
MLTHVAGSADEELTRIAGWSQPDVVDALRQVNLTTPGDAGFVRRALVLHTDIAALRRRPEGYDLPRAAGSTYLVDDGLGVGLSHGTFHWDIGREIIARLLSTRLNPRSLGDLFNDRDKVIVQKGIAHAGPELEMARTWFRTTAALLQSWGEYPELNLQVKAARQIVGADAVLLLYEGTTHQTFAGDAMRSFVVEQQLQTVAPTPSEERMTAEALFRAALKLDASLSEARIRLGHVLGDRGRHTEAAKELHTVLQSPITPYLDYYASLLLGREEQALGHRNDARSAFERARGLYPHAQSPYLGLSQIAMAEGDRVGARALLSEAIQPLPDSQRQDPWWNIDRVHEPSAEVLLTRMRQEFSK